MAKQGDACPHGGATKGNGNCTNPGPDGQPVQCVGEWANTAKHAYLRLYIEATRETRRKYLKSGAHGPPGGAGFVDLFAGPGKCRVRDTGEVVDGSPLVALAITDAPFSRVVLCDLDEENVAALRERTRTQASRVRIVPGDCNSIVSKLVGELPANGLNLALIDPFALAPLRFSTIAALAKQRHRLDLIINFPTSDARRNLKLYLRDDNEVLDHALGTTGWRAVVRTTKDVPKLLDIFVEQLDGIGDTGTRNRTIRVTHKKNTELYRLVFASKHKLGDDIWSRVTQHDPSGQRGWGF